MTAQTTDNANKWTMTKTLDISTIIRLLTLPLLVHNHTKLLHMEEAPSIDREKL